MVLLLLQHQHQLDQQQQLLLVTCRMLLPGRTVHTRQMLDSTVRLLTARSSRTPTAVMQQRHQQQLWALGHIQQHHKLQVQQKQQGRWAIQSPASQGHMLLAAGDLW
jgi:hypothetical protein